ncbi:phospholipase D-like domain-containing protein [Streptomyces sp. NPDC003674]|uniref:phospholipase D-like domain-containing protein n=1 Tax=Streptomyces sp. 1-11 TaxID=2590549 RepID=UPI00117E583D|nr:phospholipase D-like domain-containing protein [Streptomyces sp. 1-11]
MAATLITCGLNATSGETAFAVESGPVFNVPTGTTAEQQAIRSRFLDVIQSAEVGGTLKLAMYHFWDTTVAQAFADAHARGVNVQIVMDSSETTSSHDDEATYPVLRDALGTDTSAASFVTMCGTNHSCNSTVEPSINHNKFLIYDYDNGAYSTVVQSSSNLTPSSYSKYWNDAMVIDNDHGVYLAYTAYFNALKSKNPANWAYLTPTPYSPYAYYFFPRPADDPRPGDTVTGILNNVTCTYAEGGTTKHSTVRIGMYKFTRQAVADKLKAMKSDGCNVDVVYTEMDSADSTGSAGTWEALHYSGGPTLRCFSYDDDGDESTASSPTPRQIIHSKFLLIEGDYADTTGRKVMWTGSHNYTGPALTKNDESLLKVDDATVYAAYLARYNAVRTAAKPGTSDNTPACKGVTSTPEN